MSAPVPVRLVYMMVAKKVLMKAQGAWRAGVIEMKIPVVVVTMGVTMRVLVMVAMVRKRVSSSPRNDLKYAWPHVHLRCLRLSLAFP